MNDYRDRFEEQLIAASRQLTDAAEPRRNRVLRVSRRTVSYTAVGLVFAGTAAVAATRPWEPVLGDPQFPQSSATATASSPPKRQLDLLGVLRREAGDSDRGAEVTTSLKFLGSGTREVRTAFIRRVGVIEGVGTAVIVPARSWQPSPEAPERRVTDPVCVVITQSAFDAASKNCWSTEAIRVGEATGSLGADLYGLVPDGISEVVATFAGQSGLLGSSPSTTSEVTDNFFTLRAPAMGDSEAPVPQRPVHLEGLDEDGRILLELRP